MSSLDETLPGDGWAIATNDISSADRPCIVVLAGDRPGRTYRLSGDCVLGRAADAAIRFPLEDVSRYHARICVDENGGYRIDDLESRNGLRVNGVPTTTSALAFGDRVTIGKTVLLLFTQQDGLEEQLLRAQKLESLGRLAGGIAHDFNNLLGTVLTNISFLRTLDPNHTLGDSDVIETLEDSEAALRRAADLTRQLLGFARRGKYRDRPTNVSELTQDVARLVRRTVGPKIRIELDVESDLMVLGDATQLHQVLMNIYMNACDAMEEGGVLKIRASRRSGDISPSGHVAIEVEDNGTGMDDETRARAFEPFFTTKDVGKGTGLGLAMVYGIVKNHGGDVFIDTLVGVGTTVTTVLPLGDAASHPQSGSTAGVEEPMVGGRLLLVDDDDLFRSSTRRLLEHLGYFVQDVDGGRAALELCETSGSEIDLVLLDLQMPDMTGEETLAGLLQQDPQRRVLLVTAFADDTRARAALAAGARGFVQKPFNIDALQRAIADAGK